VIFGGWRPDAGVACAACALVVSLAIETAHAEPATGSPTETVTTARRARPDHGGPRDYVAEARANFTPENRAYSGTRVALGFVEPFYNMVVGLILLFSGASARMRDFANTLSRNRYVRALLYLTPYVMASFVLTFPLNWYQGFALEHRFKLSNQTFGAWIGDEGKGLLVSLVFFGLTGLLSLAYLAIEKSAKRWWLWLALGSIPVIVIGTLITPLVIDPLYNKFTPLRNQELRGKILDLAAKAGIPGRKVYEVDKSQQTKKFNAYVNGFGASQRIVLWDTMLKGMSEDEILVVMGHEMGHYKLGHIWKAIALNSVLSLLLFFLSARIMSWAVLRFGDRWGFHELHDLASLPLMVVTLGLVSLLSQPLVNSVTRMSEHEADTFALEVTRLNDAAARVFLKLGSQNRSNPEPSATVKIFQYTHPPLIERIRYALQYQPWTEGKPNRAFRGGT